MPLLSIVQHGFELSRRSDVVYGALGHGSNNGTHDGDDGAGHPTPNPIAVLVLALTAFGFIALLFCINYTYGRLLPTLCMVESPETTTYVPVDALASEDDESSAPPAYQDQADEAAGVDDELAPAVAKPTASVVDEEHLVQNKPVTASLRTAIQHLRNRAGYWSRFRGLSVYLVWNVGVNLLAGMLAPLYRSMVMAKIAVVLAQVATATILMTWIHIVISEPSAKRWYRRIPSFRTWPKIAPAVALWAVITQVVSTLPMLICGSFGSLKHLRGSNPEYEPGKRDLYIIGAQGLLGMLIYLILFVLLEVPATVTMVRVAASMLPEEDETIVSFDRTFGGKTTPAIVGGSGKIGLVEAWRSFPWASRVRLLKLVAKVAVIVLAIWIGMVAVLTLEAHLLLRDSLQGVMKDVHDAFGRP